MGLDLYIKKKNRDSKELAYFRKINFLIPFIEDYYNINLENCKDVEIDKECIEELLIRCNEVLADNSLAEKLLPTEAGFFFGDTEYNEFYFNNVKQVRDKCVDLANEFDSLKNNEYIVFNIWY